MSLNGINRPRRGTDIAALSMLAKEAEFQAKPICLQSLRLVRAQLLLDTQWCSYNVKLTVTQGGNGKR